MSIEENKPIYLEWCAKVTDWVRKYTEFLAEKYQETWTEAQREHAAREYQARLLDVYGNAYAQFKCCRGKHIDYM